MSDLERDRIVQKRLHWRAACELLDDGLIYEQRSLLTRSSTRVPFESIPDDPIRETRISRSWTVAVTAGFAALLLALQPLAQPDAAVPAAPMVLAAAALIFSLFGLRARSGHFIVFPCEGKRIVFREDARTTTLATFLDRLQVQKSKYLSETYGPRPAEPSGDPTEFGVFDETEDDPSGYRH